MFKGLSTDRALRGRQESNINVEIERGTQVLVDTIRDAVQENLGRLYPIIEKLAREQGMDLDELADFAPKISQDMTQL